MTRPDRLERGLWWDEAWTLVHGCTPVSPACLHCWSATASAMRASNPNPKVAAANVGLTERRGGCPTFTGCIRLQEHALRKPLGLKRPRTYAVWNDLFHPDVPARFVHAAYTIMAACRQHTFIVLTKRPERLIPVLYHEGAEGPPFALGDALPNVWHLTTIEVQNVAAARLAHLLALRDLGPWPVLGISAEPLLGPLRDLPTGLDWIIVGGETGPHARPMHPWWPLDLAAEAARQKIPFFFKSWGEYLPDLAKNTAGVTVAVGRDRDVRTDLFPDRFPMVPTRRVPRPWRYLLGGRIRREMPKAAEAEAALLELETP